MLAGAPSHGHGPVLPPANLDILGGCTITFVPTRHDERYNDYFIWGRLVSVGVGGTPKFSEGRKKLIMMKDMRARRNVVDIRSCH